MKAVIFSCSLNNSKHSTTMAWCKMMFEKFKTSGIQSHIINLRDYDYEATLSGDELHKQLAHVYDANYILFAAPINMGNTTFSCKNLIDRFVHANAKAKKNKIDIFENKIWEYVTFGAHVESVDNLGNPIVRNYNKNFSEWPQNHGYLREQLHFIDHLHMDDLAMGTFHPDDPTAPSFDNIHQSEEAIKMCNRIVIGFEQKNITKKLPNCSKEKFLEMFKSDDMNAFGRGTTLAEDNLNLDSVQQNIKYINKTILNTSHKVIIFICMKERCIRMGRNDLAKLYYVQQFEIIRRKKIWQDTYGKNLPNRVTLTKVPSSCHYNPIGY